jgi:hypothetical protein
MMELGVAFAVLVLFSLGVDYMMWHHFTTIYEAQFALTNKLLENFEKKATGPTGVSGHTELFIDPAGISGGIGEEE